MSLARAGMLICPNGRPLLGSLAVYFYAWLRCVVPEIDTSKDRGCVYVTDINHETGHVTFTNVELKELYPIDKPLRPMSNRQKKRLGRLFSPSPSPSRIVGPT